MNTLNKVYCPSQHRTGFSSRDDGKSAGKFRNSGEEAHNFSAPFFCVEKNVARSFEQIKDA